MKSVLWLPFVNGKRYQSPTSLSYGNDCVNHAFGVRVFRHQTRPRSRSQAGIERFIQARLVPFFGGATSPDVPLILVWIQVAEVCTVQAGVGA